MNLVSLKLKYAGTAFLAVVVAAFAFVCLFAWQLHLHSQRVESLAQAAVHVTAGSAPAATTAAARTASSLELLKRLHLVSQTDLLDGLALAGRAGRGGRFGRSVARLARRFQARTAHHRADPQRRALRPGRLHAPGGHRQARRIG
ncbi:MAG: hypothetical protein WDM77_01045 [Steroidobacteraceae bacterium]